MTLEQILKEIKEVKPFAEGNAEEGPIETLNGRRGRKVQAIERMKQLKRQYKRDLMRGAQFLIVVGTERDELAKELTTGKQGLFSADPNQFYKDLSARVNPALYSGRSTVYDLFDVLGRLLEDKAAELDIVEYPQLIFKDKYSILVKNQQEFIGLVRDVINEQMGTEVVGIQAVNSIIDTAIEKSHGSKSTSIVLNVDSEKLATDILRDFDRLTNKVHLIVAGECPAGLVKIATDERAVLIEKVGKDSLKQIVNSLKGKNNG